MQPFGAGCERERILSGPGTVIESHEQPALGPEAGRVEPSIAELTKGRITSRDP